MQAFVAAASLQLETATSYDMQWRSFGDVRLEYPSSVWRLFDTYLSSGADETEF